MKHFIIGTAGHVDHGKTALVKALTGIDCDTHKEEKQRGITINLGFAHLDLSQDLSIGIVDVPGHSDFVHTMVGGASGIDLAMLVVAADAGVMPQTREHLQIMDVLGIRSGLVALTKKDLVDPDMLGLAEEELKELLKGTFLQGCPIVPVSSVTGDGLELLKKTIGNALENLEQRTRGEVFRLFPDRIFSVAGFGTVVTGSVLGGSIKNGDTVYLLPPEKKLRVRRLEHHGKEVDEVTAGDRASMNLVGMERSDFERGMVIADRLLVSTKLIDANLRLFEHSRSFDLWTQVIFHLGTFEHQARVHLIDRKALLGGESGLVQIHLDSPCAVQYNDRFVIRSTSSDLTFGGGEIIDPAPLHHRRRTDSVIEHMGKIAVGKLPELIASEIKKRRSPLSADELGGILNVSPKEIADASGQSAGNLVPYSFENRLYLAVLEERDKLADEIVKLLKNHHARHPLDEKGRTVEEMMGVFGIGRASSADVVFRLMLDELESNKKIKRVGKTWALHSHTVNIGEEQKRRIEFVENYLKDSGMSIPLLADLYEKAGKQGIDDSEAKQILGHLVGAGKAYTHEGEFLHASHVDRVRKTMLKALVGKPEGLGVAQFRDLIDGNRKICLLFFGIFDSEGIIGRTGDVRVLTKKGATMAQTMA